MHRGLTGLYGRLKLTAERRATETDPRCTMLPIQPIRANIVRTILDLALMRDEIRVDSDPRGNPTRALSLAGRRAAYSRNPLAGASLLPFGWNERSEPGGPRRCDQIRFGL